MPLSLAFTNFPLDELPDLWLVLVPTLLTSLPFLSSQSCCLLESLFLRFTPTPTHLVTLLLPHDTALLRSLLASTLLPPSLPPTLLSILSPWPLLLALASSLSFSHQPFLEWLLSPETAPLALELLLRSATLAAEDWNHVALLPDPDRGSLLELFSRLSLALERAGHRDLLPFDPVPLLRRLEKLDELWAQEPQAALLALKLY